jgi:4-amino-4-deoxy-L-arabinose transferase-like glycosyltransferase
MLSVPGAPSSSPTRPERASRDLVLFLVLLGLYLAIHVTLRLALSAVLAIDEAREALLSQTFQVGYLPRQPPLYNWLVWGGVRLLGISTTTLILCRYLTLAVAYLFLYLSATHVLSHRTLALMAPFSLILMGPFNWDTHEELTHSLAALAAASATFYALLRLERSGSVLAYLGFGAAIAAGFLAKFSYGFFAGSLLVAALTTPEYRRRVLSPRFGLTVGAAAVLCAPYALWFTAHDLSITRMYAEEVRREGGSGYLEGVARGFYHLGRMLFIYLMPFLLVFLVAFWRGWRSAPGGRGQERRLLEALFLAEAGLAALAILAGNLTYLRVRWLMPAFFLVPLVALAWVESATLERRRLVRYAAGLIIVEAVVVLALTINVLRGDALGRPTRLNAPYDVVAAALSAAGFTRGTIAAGEGQLAGNLRVHFPDSRILRLTNPDYVPPPTGGGQCLVVWEQQIGDPSALQAWVASALDAVVEGEPVRTISARYHHARERVLEVSYVLIPGGRGRCR